MGRRTIVSGLLSCLALATACNRTPAVQAIAEGEQAIEAARPQLEAYAPQELAALVLTARDARARLDEGHYTDALRLAQRLPGQARDALERSGRRKAELDAEWAQLSGQLPPVLRGLELRLAAIQAKTAPSADGRDPLQEPRERLVAVKSSWTRAQDAAQAGRTTQAVATGRETAAAAGGLAQRLGFTAVQAAALASAVAAAEAAIPTPAGAVAPAAVTAPRAPVAAPAGPSRP